MQISTSASSDAGTAGSEGGAENSSSSSNIAEAEGSTVGLNQGPSVDADDPVGGRSASPDIEATWIGWARTTPSVAHPGAVMYLDETDVTNGVAQKDAIVLMEEHFDVTATHMQYGEVNDDGERSPATAKDGQVALRDLQAALARGDAPIVAVNSAVLWTAVPNQGAEPFPNYVDADHAIVVTALDMEKLRISVNDSSGFRGMVVPYGAFMDGWQSNNFEMIVVSLNNPGQGEVAAA
ncbi:MAG: hypothetical protein AB7G47_11645 [Mycolicibacterium sp.]|uniref:hypothetical protein n=1 Tax=Mycolicibacterium sp. TaxID=2320850 RepID=UPI003D0F765A